MIKTILAALIVIGTMSFTSETEAAKPRVRPHPMYGNYSHYYRKPQRQVRPNYLYRSPQRFRYNYRYSYRYNYQNFQPPYFYGGRLGWY